MIIPSGVTIVFDGGSFTGDIDNSNVKFKNSVVFVGSVEDSNVVAVGNSTFASGTTAVFTSCDIAFSFLVVAGNVTINNGTFNGPGILTVSGSLNVDVPSSFTFGGIVTTSTGTTKIKCNELYGEDVSVTELEVSSSFSVDDVKLRKLTVSDSNFSASYIGNLKLSENATLNLESPVIVNTISNEYKITINTLNNNSFFTAKEISDSDFLGFELNGNGYLAVPHDYDIDSVDVVDNGKVCYYGAQIMSISVETLSNTSVKTSVTRLDSVPYLIEKRLNDSDEYTLINSVEEESEVTSSIESGKATVIRVFDGDAFFSDVAYPIVIPPSGGNEAFKGYYVYNLGSYSFNNTIRPFRAEPVVFLGVVKKGGTGEKVLRSNVNSVSVSVFKYHNYQYSNIAVTPVERWTNVQIDKRCFLESPRAFDIWDSSDLCNFCWIPNQSTEAFTSNSGTYSARFTAELTSGDSVDFSLDFEVL